MVNFEKLIKEWKKKVKFQEVMEMWKKIDSEKAKNLEQEGILKEHFTEHPENLKGHIFTDIWLRYTKETAKELAKTNFKACLIKDLKYGENTAIYHAPVLNEIRKHMVSENREKLIQLVQDMYEIFQKGKRSVGLTYQLGELFGGFEVLRTIIFSENGPERLSDLVKDPRLREDMITAEELAEKDIHSCLEKTMFQVTSPYRLHPAIVNEMVKVYSENPRKKASYVMATLGLIRKYIRTRDMNKLREIANTIHDVQIHAFNKLVDFDENVNHMLVRVYDQQKKFKDCSLVKYRKYGYPEFSLGLLSGIYEMLDMFLSKDDKNWKKYKWDEISNLFPF